MQRRRTHIVLDDGVAAAEPVFFSESVEDPLRRVPLPDWPPLVFFQNGVDHAQPRAQLGPLHRLLPLVARRHRVAQHLAHRLPRQTKLPRYSPLTPPLNQNRSPHPPIELHLVHPSGVP